MPRKIKVGQRLSLVVASVLALWPTEALSDFVCNIKMNPAEITEESIQVFQSKDAGAYYCEHAFCINVQGAAYNPHIASDSNGEKLVGFLHVEQDKHLFSEVGTYSQASRHQKTRFVMGNAIKGYFASLLKSEPSLESYKLLLTGYDKFESIKNNPTHDFVTHEENIDAAMEIAFGSKQHRAFTSPGQLNYVVTINGKPKLLTIKNQSLPVDDGALNTLPETVRTFNPNAVISMGVASEYAVEVRATDRGLAVSNNGFMHDPKSPITIERENYSLWNAIMDGSNVPKPLP